MTSSESSNQNSIEVNGVLFKTLVPQPIITIPPYGEETSVQFGVRMTNQSDTPYRFELPRFLPEFLVPDGRIMKIGVNRNHVRDVRDSDIPLLMPGKSLESWLEIRFFWLRQGLLVVGGGQVLYGGFWGLYDVLS